MEVFELVRASQAGDMGCFVELLKLKKDVIYRVARTYTRSPHDAEDCISEASIHAYERIKQLKLVYIDLCMDEFSIEQD
jgi:RNA polymerase sigma-70 factor, ECF subfamily